MKGRLWRALWPRCARDANFGYIWGPIGRRKKKTNPMNKGGVATKFFWGSMGCLGGCILGWLTGFEPPIVVAVRGRCNDTPLGTARVTLQPPPAVLQPPSVALQSPSVAQ